MNGRAARWMCIAMASMLALLAVPTAGAGPSRVPMEPYRVPIARKWLDRQLITRPHHDHPAWDMNLPTGTPVVAVQAGKVRAILGGSSCGNGIVIDGADGLTYTYCHASRILTGAGRIVHAGQRIMASGNTGSSGRPHLHLEIERGPALTNLCPQPLLLSWWRGGTMSPYDAPKSGCTY